MQDAVHFKERVRARCVPTGGGKSRPQLYNPERTTRWEEWVGEQALEQLRQVHLDGDEDFTLPIRESRVLASFRYNLRKPSSYPKSVTHMVRKPDLDNVSKSLLDGLVKAGVLADDAMVSDQYHCKRYASAGHPPGVECELVSLPLA